MCVCIPIKYMCTHIQVCVHTHAHSWVHVDMNTCICTHIHIFRCMQLPVYIHIQVCVDIHTFWHMNIHMYTHIHMYLLFSSGASQECLKTTAAFQKPESTSPSGPFTLNSKDTVLAIGCVDSVFYLGVIYVRCGQVCLYSSQGHTEQTVEDTGLAWLLHCFVLVPLQVPVCSPHHLAMPAATPLLS